MHAGTDALATLGMRADNVYVDRNIVGATWRNVRGSLFPRSRWTQVGAIRSGRLFVERAVTVNTTAAGDIATLMSLDSE